MTDPATVYLANIAGAYHPLIPYSCGALRAYAEQDPLVRERFRFAPFLFHTADGVVALASTVTDPSILGLSVYQWNMNRSMKLARLVKDRFPDCLVVVGGPHVPDDSRAVADAHPYVDIWVHKEGERTFHEILRAHAGGTGYHTISGITLRHEGAVVQTPPRTDLLRPIDYPSPWLLGYFDDIVSDLKAKGLERIGIWETNRGCPYSCTFCDWGAMTNQKVRQFDTTRIMAEVDWIATNLTELHIADANFGILPRDVEIAARLAEVASQPGGSLRAVAAAYAKNNKDRVFEITRTFTAHGLLKAGVTMSVQSYDPTVLSTIKRQNIAPEGYHDLQRRFDAAGIPTYSELILGLPNDTPESFLGSVEIILEGKPSSVRYYALNLYENSAVSTPESRAEHQFETEMFNIVDSIHSDDEKEFIETVVGTRTMPRNDLRFIKKMTEALDYVHIGKWLYYVSWYLKRERGYAITRFYYDLFKFCANHKDSVMNRCMTSWFIKNYNSGSFVMHKGPVSPFGIDWGSFTFRKNTFHWLCIALHQDQFYAEAIAFLQERGLWNDTIADLVSFQRAMMINFDYDPAVGKSVTLDHDWWNFFETDAALERRRNTVSFHDTHIGRLHQELRPNDPDSFFHVAGGCNYYSLDVTAYTHKQSSLRYFEDESNQHVFRLGSINYEVSDDPAIRPS